MSGLVLPSVTLCAATSTNLAATVRALEASLQAVDVAECLLFTDGAARVANSRIRVIQIERLSSASDYSTFILKALAGHVRTEHCLVVQWDGFVINPANWTDDFLSYDYIGAPWPQYHDGLNVGNGGFSLRSRRLMQACAAPSFGAGHPEDLAIGRTHRARLERDHGICFAPEAMAQRFSVERSGKIAESFGFHGAFNLVPAVGADGFWDVYRTLDDRRSVFLDYRRILLQLGGGSHSIARRNRLSWDCLRYRVGS